MRSLCLHVGVLCLLAFLAKSQFDGFGGGVEEDAYGGGDMNDYDSYMDMMKGMGMEGMGGMGGMEGMGGGPITGGGGEVDDPYGDGPAPVELQSLEEMNAFVEDLQAEQAAVLGYFDTNGQSADFMAFAQVANEFGQDFRFGIIMDETLLRACPGCVYVYRPARYTAPAKYGERVKHRYPSTIINTKSLKSFLWKAAPNLVGVLGTSTQVLYNHVSLPLVIVFGDYDMKSDHSAHKYLTNRALKVAEKYKDKMVFAVASVRDLSERWITDFELLEEIEKSNKERSGIAVGMGIIHDRQTWSKSPMIKFSPDSLTEYVEDFLGGKLGKGLEFNPPGAPSDEDGEDGAPGMGTEEVTTANYDSIIRDGTKDVLLEVYAPWCGHCRSLASEYQQVAEHFGDDDGVTIASMDGTTHPPPADIAGDIQGYPTILFFPAVTKGEREGALLNYDGERTSNEIISYVQKHRHTK